MAGGQFSPSIDAAIMYTSALSYLTTICRTLFRYVPRLNVVLLESQTQFDVWLDDNHGLHDASVTAISPLPDGASLPETVTVTFRFQIAGGYAAGDERTIRTCLLYTSPSPRD